MPKKTFQEAIKVADHLSWQEGLQAIKRSEGRGQISAKDSGCLLGSACIDDDCNPAFPNDCRWDYVIGYKRAKKAVAYFVEVHGAQTSKVSEVERKLGWLLDYLGGKAQSELANLTREIHWVATAGIDIPKHTPQYKTLTTRLRKMGLQGPTKHLELA
jgi:hypothetical protein